MWEGKATTNNRQTPQKHAKSRESQRSTAHRRPTDRRTDGRTDGPTDRDPSTTQPAKPRKEKNLGALGNNKEKTQNPPPNPPFCAAGRKAEGEELLLASSAARRDFSSFSEPKIDRILFQHHRSLQWSKTNCLDLRKTGQRSPKQGQNQGANMQ